MVAPIASALLVPSEVPPDVQEIKKALLSFDRVHIPNPDDRDVIPRHAFWAAITGFPMSMEGGRADHVVPLGKTDGFDDAFSQLEQQLETARRAGAVLVDPSIQPPPDLRGSVGRVTLGRGVPRPDSVYRFFRALAANSSILGLTVEGTGLRQWDVDELAAVATRGIGFGADNLSPKVAQFPNVVDPVRQEYLQKIAVARVALIARFLATSEVRDLQLLIGDAGLVAVLRYLHQRAGEVMEIRADPPAVNQLKLLRRLHDVIVAEYLDHEKLAMLSVKDVMRLRTRAWGRALEARTDLFRTVDEIARDAESRRISFEELCRKAFDSYQSRSADYQHEAKKYGVRSTLNLAGVGITATQHATVEQLVHALSGVSGGALLALGALGIRAVKELGPKGLDLLRARKERRCSYGYSLARPYGGLLHSRRN